jgi:hypothetical protein
MNPLVASCNAPLSTGSAAIVIAIIGQVDSLRVFEEQFDAARGAITQLRSCWRRNNVPFLFLLSHLYDFFMDLLSNFYEYGASLETWRWNGPLGAGFYSILSEMQV